MKRYRAVATVSRFFVVEVEADNIREAYQRAETMIEGMDEREIAARKGTISIGAVDEIDDEQKDEE